MTINGEISRQQAAIQKVLQKRYAEDFESFALGLMIPSAVGLEMFHSIVHDFQRRMISEVAPALHAIRDGDLPASRRFWIEMTKKAGKDAFLGICLLWLAAYGRRPLFCQVGAADRDQAAIVKRRIQGILYHNPWLQELVIEKQYQIVSKNGNTSIEIVAADIAGSHGETPDLLVINELSHVTKWEFVENLLDNAAGVPRGVVIIATNAGYRGTPAEKLRKTAMGSDDWSVHLFKRPAPWLSKSDIQEAKARNSPSRYARLFEGKWPSGKGDALDEDKINQCFHDGLGPLAAPEPGWTYVAGMDLGTKRDHAGVAVVGVHTEIKKIRVAWVQGFEPILVVNGKKEVCGEDVMLAARSANHTFRLDWFGYDPAEGGTFMAQELRNDGAPMMEMSFGSPANQSAMATALVQVINDNRLISYEDVEGRLRRDLGMMSIVEKPNGYKIEAVRDEHGHADVGIALTICLPRALEIMRTGGGLLRPDDDLGYGGDAELTDDEMDGMPDDLREIYEDDLSDIVGRYTSEAFEY